MPMFFPPIFLYFPNFSPIYIYIYIDALRISKHFEGRGFEAHRGQVEFSACEVWTHSLEIFLPYHITASEHNNTRT